MKRTVGIWFAAAISIFLSIVVAFHSTCLKAYERSTNMSPEEKVTFSVILSQLKTPP